MTPRKLSQVIASGMLMALLALPVPVQAASSRTRGPAGVWEWLVRAWQRGVSAVVPAERVERKEGGGFDPNGLRATGQGGEGQGGDPNAGEGAAADPRG